MKVTTLDESVIQDIGHAFGYYDYGAERGLINAFPSREATAVYISGYMRRVMELVFTEGNRLGVPVILETDAKSKCDRYIQLGMELAGTRSFGEAYWQALLFIEVMNVYDGIVIDKLWVGHSKFWVIPGLEDMPYVQTWRQVLKKRSMLALILAAGAALVGSIVVLIF